MERPVKKGKKGVKKTIRDELRRGTTVAYLKTIYTPSSVDLVQKREVEPEIQGFLEAARTGQVKKVEEYINNGLSPNVQSREQLLTPLMEAARNSAGTSNLDTVNLLLQHPDINPNLQDNNGFTALHKAARRAARGDTSNVETVIALLQHPAINPNIAPRGGYTALYNASIAGATEAVSALLQHPMINPNVQDINIGQNALMIAVRERNFDIVKALLKHPLIDVNLRDNTGRMAHHDCPDRRCKMLFHRFYVYNHIGKRLAENPGLPRDVWRQTLIRNLQQELCIDLHAAVGTEELLVMAHDLLQVPSEEINRWERERKSKAEICKIVSGLLSIGAMYSERAMEFLARRERLGRTASVITRLIGELEELGIEPFYYDEVTGEKRWKSPNALLEEIAIQQRYEDQPAPK